MRDFAELVATIDSSGVKRGGEDLKKFSKTAEDTERKTKGATDRMAANFNRSGSNIAATLGRITGRLVALGAAAVSVGQAGRTLAQFDSAMSKVAAITGSTGAELDKMRGLAQQLGSTTEFSATQAADALTFLGMAGFEASESMAALPAVLDLATASGMGLAQTADIASNVLSGFGMEAKNSADVADVLAAASTSANTSVSQLGQAMSTAAPIAASLGIGLEETAASIGVMSDAGIQGERAGTALRGVLASLANPTKAARDALAEYGLTAAEVDPQTEGLANVMARLRDAGISTADAMTVFGREAASGALVLVKGADRFRSFTEELREADGAAGDMASTMRDNLAGDVRGLMSSVEGLILALGDAGLTAVLRGVVQAVTGVVRGVSAMIGVFSDVSGEIGEFVERIFTYGMTSTEAQRATDNLTLAMSDEIRQLVKLTDEIGPGISMSKELAEAKLDQAEAYLASIEAMRQESLELLRKKAEYRAVRTEANRLKQAINQALESDFNQTTLGILPAQVEQLVGELYEAQKVMQGMEAEAGKLSPEYAAAQARVDELRGAIETASGGVVRFSDETDNAVVLTERLALVAGGVSFEAATASAAALSRQLGVSLEIANQIDRAMDRQAGIKRGGDPVRLGGDTFAAPTTGLGQGLGTSMGATLTLPDDGVSQYDALIERLDSVSVSAGGAASKQREMNDVTRMTQQILGEVNREAVTYADVVTQLSQLLKDGAISQDQFNAAVDLADEKLNNVEKSGKSVGEELGSVFSSAIKNAESFSDVLSDILSKLGDILIDAAFSGLSSSFSGGGGGGLLGGAIIPGILHSGGVAGKDGYGHGRSVSPLAFAGARRYHSGGIAGLRPNEVPTILERGERVFPKNTKFGSAVDGTATIRLIAPEGFSVEQEGRIQGIALKTSAEVVGTYDRHTLPNSVKRIQGDPLRRGG